MRCVLCLMRVMKPVAGVACAGGSGSSSVSRPTPFVGGFTEPRSTKGHNPGTTTDEHDRLMELEREKRELWRANAIVKASAEGFFSGCTATDQDYRTVR